jgi:type VI secretion system protein ImpA
VNLDDSGDLALLEAYQIFGQDTLDARQREKGEEPRRETRKNDRPPNWGELEELTQQCLTKSKDLRALAHLGACALRTQGFTDFVDILGVASKWLDSHWAEVYPLIEEDAVLRTNSLSAFADRPAIIDGLRRVSLYRGERGNFSLRDLEALTAPVSANDGSGSPDALVSAAFKEMPIEDLRSLHGRAVEAGATLRAIDQKMQDGAGSASAPAFDPILAQLSLLASSLRARLAEHPKAVPGVDDAVSPAAMKGEEGAGPVGAVGAIRSRQDAIRALDAVAEFFRRSEPSSPVPLLVDRAKRLVSKSFLEVLADVAPGALSEAKSASGIRE